MGGWQAKTWMCDRAHSVLKPPKTYPESAALAARRRGAGSISKLPQRHAERARARLLEGPAHLGNRSSNERTTTPLATGASGRSARERVVPASWPRSVWGNAPKIPPASECWPSCVDTRGALANFIRGSATAFTSGSAANSCSACTCSFFVNVSGPCSSSASDSVLAPAASRPPAPRRRPAHRLALAAQPH